MMGTVMNGNLTREVLLAAQMAVRAHHGQKRKRSEDPYVVHPFRVAERLLTHPLPAEADRRVSILAAILHDVLEDTDMPRERIVEAFGEPVALVVDELTQDASLPKAERRSKMIEGCGSYSLEGRLVKLSDRWDNLTEIDVFERDFIVRYCEEASRMVVNMRGTWPVAEQAIREIIEAHHPSDP